MRDASEAHGTLSRGLSSFQQFLTALNQIVGDFSKALRVIHPLNVAILALDCERRPWDQL
jgi:hypothetical protein